MNQINYREGTKRIFRKLLKNPNAKYILQQAKNIYEIIKQIYIEKEVDDQYINTMNNTQDFRNIFMKLKHIDFDLPSHKIKDAIEYLQFECDCLFDRYQQIAETEMFDNSFIPRAIIDEASFDLPGLSINDLEFILKENRNKYKDLQKDYQNLLESKEQIEESKQYLKQKQKRLLQKKQNLNEQIMENKQNRNQIEKKIEHLKEKESNYQKYQMEYNQLFDQIINIDDIINEKQQKAANAQCQRLNIEEQIELIMHQQIQYVNIEETKENKINLENKLNTIKNERQKTKRSIQRKILELQSQKSAYNKLKQLFQKQKLNEKSLSEKNEQCYKQYIEKKTQLQSTQIELAIIKAEFQQFERFPIQDRISRAFQLQKEQQKKQQQIFDEYQKKDEEIDQIEDKIVNSKLKEQNDQLKIKRQQLLIQRAEIKNKIMRCDQGINGYNQQIKQLKTTNPPNQNQLKQEINKKEKIICQLQSKISKISRQINLNQTELSSYRNTIYLKERQLKDNDKNIKKLQRQIKYDELQLKQQQNYMDSYQKAIQQVQEELKNEYQKQLQLKDICDNRRKEIANIDNAIKVLNIENQKHKTHIANLEQRQQYCLQGIRDKYILREQIYQLNDQICRLNIDLTTLQSSMQQNNLQIYQIAMSIQQYDLYLKNAATQGKNQQKKLSKLDQEINQIRLNIRKLEMAQEYSSIYD